MNSRSAACSARLPLPFCGSAAYCRSLPTSGPFSPPRCCSSRARSAGRATHGAALPPLPSLAFCCVRTRRHLSSSVFSAIIPCSSRNSTQYRPACCALRQSSGSAPSRWGFCMRSSSSFSGCPLWCRSFPRPRRGCLRPPPPFLFSTDRISEFNFNSSSRSRICSGSLFHILLSSSRSAVSGILTCIGSICNVYGIQECA